MFFHNGKKEPYGICNRIFAKIIINWMLCKQNIRTLLACKCLIEDYKHRLKSINLGKISPVGWFTYPFLEHLESCNISELKIFEWGAGNSTLMWANRCKKVISIENNEKWFLFTKDHLNNFHNVNIILKVDCNSYASCINTYQDIDIILIDGKWRYQCAEAALKNISVDSLIILDNSEWCPDTNVLLQSHGYARIDFPGFGPSNQFTWCTSIFFKSIKSPLLHPVKLPSCIGGIPHDECGYMFAGEHK